MRAGVFPLTDLAVQISCSEFLKRDSLLLTKHA